MTLFAIEVGTVDIDNATKSEGVMFSSMAISLKRIADALEVLAYTRDGIKREEYIAGVEALRRSATP